MSPSASERTNSASTRRRVRSFVRRPGRLTPAQQRALDLLLQHYAIDPETNDLRNQFDRPAPLVIEIGCGNGDAMVWMAGQEPDKNFIGVEVHEPGIGRLLRGLEAHDRGNVRVAMLDAVDLLDAQVQPASIDEFRIYFPDPWPKKRHHKRRLIQAPLVEQLAELLVPGGLLHLATDWQPYAEWMQHVMLEQPGFNDISLPRHARPAWRPQTHFERRGLRKGHIICDLIYQKRE